MNSCPCTEWPPAGIIFGGGFPRNAAVIHLRAPSDSTHYNYDNPLRIETHLEAQAIDGRIAEAWAGHSRYYTVPPTDDCIGKAAQALDLLRDPCRPVVERRCVRSSGAARYAAVVT